MSDAGRALTKVTVNLTPRAMDALGEACARTGDSRTDTINRALVVYQRVLELMDGRGYLDVTRADGSRERVHIL